MRLQHNKLVRDRIPEIIEGEGKTCRTETMCEKEYQRALAAKLQEEASELQDAGSAQEMIRELADVFEVIDAFIDAHGIDRNEIATVRTHRRESRGSFACRLKLLWVEQTTDADD